MRPGRAAALALLLAGCAHTTTLTVLPDADTGHVGAVALIGPGGSETVIDTAGGQAVAGRTVRIRTLSPAQQAALVRGLDLPLRAIRFLLNMAMGADQPDSSPANLQIIDAIRAEVARRPGAQVEVAGFTDTTGPMDLNDQLSLRRAQTFADRLIAMGIAGDQIRAIGRGEREPLVPTPDETPEPRNRRIEVTIY